MRTTEVTIDKTKYLLCYSTAVAFDIQDNVNGLADAVNNVQTGSFRDIVKLLSALMDAGYRYAQLKHMDYPEPPTHEDLQYLTDIDDMSSILTAVLDALGFGTTPTVEVEATKGKKDKATQRKS